MNKSLSYYIDNFLDIFFRCFLIILVPVYWYYYGLQNFLWLSDIGLFLTSLALFRKNNLLMSMAAVGTMAVELVWALDFFLDLFTDYNFLNLSDYMFDDSLPLALRGLSLFHIVTPIVWIYYLYKWGYDRRAFGCFTILYWFIIILTYWLTPPADNINWVFLSKMPTWPLILMIFMPLLVFLPTHCLFKKLYEK